MKGIILAGGSGTRLYPITLAVSKQLMPVYDKPMIYYPLSILMMAGIREILIITTPDDLEQFRTLLKDGSQWGLSISYAVQPRPEGLAQAFIIGKTFIGNDSVALILGDNIFYGDSIQKLLKKACQLDKGGLIFGCAVKDPERYGIVEFDKSGNVIGIEEKPEDPKSKYAVPGLYFYDNDVIDIAEQIKPSARGELEITDINLEYLRRGELQIQLFGRGYAWIDTGTHESLQQAASFIHAVQERQGLKISCIEEIAFRLRYIDKKQLHDLASGMMENSYGEYLMGIINDEESK
jgi:glucose-1-phosphate thymidylyltransferase